VTYSFVVTPQREGTFTIPAIEVKVDGQIEATQPHTIVVTTSETGDLLYAEITGDAQQAYVGQAVKLTLKIWVRPYSDRGFEYRFSESDMWQLFSRQSDWGIFAERLEELSLENQRPAGQEVLRRDDQGVSRAYLLYEIENTIYPKRPGKNESHRRARQSVWRRLFRTLVIRSAHQPPIHPSFGIATYFSPGNPAADRRAGCSRGREAGRLPRRGGQISFHGSGGTAPGQSR
jgi:hypothetical protein